MTDRSDVYALGVILYELLSGRPPFEADNVGEMLAMHIAEKPPLLREVAPRVDPQLASLVDAMLDKQAAQRPTMEGVAQALQAMADPQGRRLSQPALPILAQQPAPLGQSPSAATPKSGPGAGDSRTTPKRRPASQPNLAPAALASGTNTIPVDSDALLSIVPGPRTVTGAPSEATRPPWSDADGSRWRARWVRPALIGGGVGLIIAATLWTRGHRDAEAPPPLPPLTQLAPTHRTAPEPTPAPEPEPPDEAPVPVRTSERTTAEPRRTAARTGAKQLEPRLASATMAFRRAQYNVAITKAMDAVDKNPLDAWTLIGKSACHNSSVTLANRSIDMLQKLPRAESESAIDEVYKDCASQGMPHGTDMRIRAKSEVPKNSQQLLVQARFQYDSGHFQAALGLAEQGLSANPAEAWETIGKSACALKQIDKANRALEALQSQKQRVNMLITACNKYHIALSGKKLSLR